MGTSRFSQASVSGGIAQIGGFGLPARIYNESPAVASFAV
jgi:hypothetical protein